MLQLNVIYFRETYNKEREKINLPTFQDSIKQLFLRLLINHFKTFTYVILTNTIWTVLQAIIIYCDNFSPYHYVEYQ